MVKQFCGLVAALTLGAAGQAAAQPAEPLVWTHVADPDPNFVPPPSSRSPATRREARKARAQEGEEQEAYAAGRTVGQTLKQLEEAQQAIARAVRNARAANGDGNR